MTAAVAVALPRHAAERLPLATRGGTIDDLPFVHDSWLLSERETSGHLEGHRFVRWHKRMAREILARPTTELRVVTPEGDPSTILGWAAVGHTSPPVVYYVFTRYPSRRLGVARMLVADLLAAPEVIYAARPARVHNEGAGNWEPHPVVSKIPRGWKYLSRANYFEP